MQCRYWWDRKLLMVTSITIPLHAYCICNTCIEGTCSYTEPCHRKHFHWGDLLLYWAMPQKTFPLRGPAPILSHATENTSIEGTCSYTEPCHRKHFHWGDLLLYWATQQKTFPLRGPAPILSHATENTSIEGTCSYTEPCCTKFILIRVYPLQYLASPHKLSDVRKTEWCLEE